MHRIGLGNVYVMVFDYCEGPRRWHPAAAFRNVGSLLTLLQSSVTKTGTSRVIESNPPSRRGGYYKDNVIRSGRFTQVEFGGVLNGSGLSG